MSQPFHASGQSRGFAIHFYTIFAIWIDRLSGKAEVTFTESERMVGQLLNRDVMISCTTQIATANNVAATRLRDEGKIDQARRVLSDNSVYLEEAGKKLQSDFLLQYGSSNRSDAQNLGADNWKRQRKIMRFGQQVNTKQQSISGPAAPNSLSNPVPPPSSSSSQKGVKTP